MNRWHFLSATAVGSLIWIAYAAPHWHPATRLHLVLSREAYIAKARQIAKQNGLPLQDLSGNTKLNTNSSQQQVRLLLPNDPIIQSYPEASVLVKFPASESASITLRPTGAPLGWKLPAAAVPRKADAFTIAVAAMEQVAGAEKAAFRPTGTPSVSSDESTYAWRRSGFGLEGEVSIEVSVKNGYARTAQTSFHIPDNVSSTSDLLSVFRVSSGVVWFLVLLIICIFQLLKEGSSTAAKAMKDRAGLRLGLASAIAVGIGAVLDWDAVSVTSPDISSTALEVLGVVIGMVAIGIMVYAVCAISFLNARLHAPQVRGFRLLATPAFPSRIVGGEILSGILASPLLLAVSLAVAALSGVPLFKTYDDSDFLNPIPALDAIASVASQANISVLALLGVMIPFGARYASRTWLRRTVVIIAVTLTTAMLNSSFRTSILANTVNVAMIGALLYGCYRYFGVLGALSAYVASGFLNNSVSLLLQPAASLRGSGVGIAIVWALALLVAATVAREGIDVVAELYGESTAPAETRSRREELLADFGVARAAQQKMLPSRMPALPGYSISASCDPAREVGGDLYDFLQLRDGRLGIGVADVSGKGVPAALYMTLTKGLLCAASQDSDDPRVILAVVNTHLREVAKKKMFVTMALGVLDPANGSVEYARAGHNPVVWRRRGLGETRMLAGAGIGLGIAAPTLFTRTLAMQKLQLAPGDALVFYSDGLTEAMNESLEQFGDDRLVAAVERTDGMPAMEARDSILKEVKRFLDGIHPQDDLTIAVLRVNEV